MPLYRHNFIRFLKYVRPYWKYLVIAIIGGIVKFTAPLLVPQVTRHLIDNVFLSDTLSRAAKFRELFLYTGVMAAIFVFIYAPWVYLRHFYADRVSHRAVFNLRCDLYYRFLKMSASYFTRNQAGSIMSRLIGDIQLAQNLVGTALTNVWMDAAAVIVVLFFLLRIDLTTTLVALVMFPVYIFIFRRFSAEIRLTTRRMQDELALMSGNASEKISGSLVVRAFGQEHKEKTRFQQESEKLFSIDMRRNLMQSLNHAVTGTLIGLAPLVVICFGGYRVITGVMSVGELIAVTLYLAPLYLPFQRFSELNVVLASSMAALDRIFEVMDQKPEINSRPDATEVDQIKGHIEFVNVDFHYDQDCPVLHDVSFTVEAGQRVALVGKSGSGKTTVVSLIPRFYDVSTGEIRIDGQDIRNIKLRCVRSQVGMVLQDPILFSGTIRENILYGRPTATDKEVMKACKAANSYDFISALPRGFDTQVGERGAMLSGGQKQRITLARAFLKNPPILILDEPTSALDSESEKLIEEAMERLLAGRTTFIIAHRLSTVIRADRILVLDAGRIVETGTHEKLMELGGLYRQLYERQLNLCV